VKSTKGSLMIEVLLGMLVMLILSQVWWGLIRLVVKFDAIEWSPAVTQAPSGVVAD